MTNSMAEIFTSDVALLIGTNTTWNHPVFGSMMKQAVKRGLKVIVCDPRRIDMVDHSVMWLQQRNGSDVALLSGLQHIILREGWHAADYIAERCENFDEYKASIDWFTPERVQDLTDVPVDKLYAAAELFARGGRAALYYCMGITQHSHGVDNVKSCVNLQLLTGNLGFEGGGVNPLRGQNNVQGACDMGGLPNVFTGYQPVTDAAARKKFCDYWKVPEDQLKLEIGMTLTTMIPACGEKIKALYVMGENPVVSDPNATHAIHQLEKLDLLVVQDIFLTETAKMAHVVLPALTFAEKHGTVTNTERRVLLTNRAVPPLAGAKADYEIVADLAARFGHEFPRTPEALFQEIRDLTPSYKGLTYDRIREVGIQWPCPAEDHPGTKFLHKDKFSRGKGILTPMQYKAPAEEPDGDWPFRLSTGRMLQHFHTGSMTRRTKVLDGIVKAGIVEINPADASKLGVTSGDRIRVVTRRGAIETNVAVVERVTEGAIFVPFHFAEASANVLTNDALDPVAKIPEFKVCAARLEKVASGSR